jgi:hypothetical protein
MDYSNRIPYREAELVFEVIKFDYLLLYFEKASYFLTSLRKNQTNKFCQMPIDYYMTIGCNI